MGFMDKAKDMAGQHDEKIDQGIEQGGDFVDDKTGGEHSEHVDKAQDFANDQADTFGGVEGGDGEGEGDKA
ncbi:antitoxin [Serinicoccus kebangsaanensis]|uniref:antitoxin n=1 Tax=Serinicoccus kebangsaanensis TaxID=2602069 RepID=UPI00124CCCEB|nr:antitoxin [Serinicoccus kebangsaanensis]